MPVEIEVAENSRPEYNRTAPGLLAGILEFYKDPENERAYQEWLRKGKPDE